MDDEQQEILAQLERARTHAAHRLHKQGFAPETADLYYVRLLPEEAGGKMDGNLLTGAC